MLNQTVDEVFFTRLLQKTNNFGDITWLGYPVWQNVLDLWTTQEVISMIRPELIIECGTNRGGSALFYATLFDLMGQGSIITIDVEKMHNLVHPRITFVIGSSIDDNVLTFVKERVKSVKGPIMVILDSDHSADHVEQEFEKYCGFVTAGSYLLVQDGVIDTLDMFAAGRPGPLAAIQRVRDRHPEFEVDEAKSQRFLITHHPSGWFRRKP
jgi:cephalosporin hydroxylase